MFHICRVFGYEQWLYSSDFRSIWYIHWSIPTKPPTTVPKRVAFKAPQQQIAVDSLTVLFADLSLDEIYKVLNKYSKQRFKEHCSDAMNLDMNADSNVNSNYSESRSYRYLYRPWWIHGYFEFMC